MEDERINVMATIPTSSLMIITNGGFNIWLCHMRGDPMMIRNHQREARRRGEPLRDNQVDEKTGAPKREVGWL